MIVRVDLKEIKEIAGDVNVEAMNGHHAIFEMEYRVNNKKVDEGDLLSSIERQLDDWEDENLEEAQRQNALETLGRIVGALTRDITGDVEYDTVDGVAEFDINIHGDAAHITIQL